MNLVTRLLSGIYFTLCQGLIINFSWNPCWPIDDFRRNIRVSWLKFVFYLTWNFKLRPCELIRVLHVYNKLYLVTYSKSHRWCRLSSLFHLSRYNDFEYPGKIIDARQHEHQVNVMCPAFLLIKTVMSRSLWKKKEGTFCTTYFVWREFF